jgi:hypothetical protein
MTNDEPRRGDKSYRQKMQELLHRRKEDEHASVRRFRKDAVRQQEREERKK